MTYRKGFKGGQITRQQRDTRNPKRHRADVSITSMAIACRGERPQHLGHRQISLSLQRQTLKAATANRYQTEMDGAALVAPVVAPVVAVAAAVVPLVPVVAAVLPVVAAVVSVVVEGAAEGVPQFHRVSLPVKFGCIYTGNASSAGAPCLESNAEPRSCK